MPPAPDSFYVLADSGPGTSTVSSTRHTAHLVREPTGEWVGLRAVTTLGGGAAGLAQAEVFDERGFVGRTAQALLVRPTPRE